MGACNAGEPVKVPVDIEIQGNVKTKLTVDTEVIVNRVKVTRNDISVKKPAIKDASTGRPEGNWVTFNENGKKGDVWLSHSVGYWVTIDVDGKKSKVWFPHEDGGFLKVRPKSGWCLTSWKPIKYGRYQGWLPVWKRVPVALRSLGLPSDRLLNSKETSSIRGSGVLLGHGPLVGSGHGAQQGSPSFRLWVNGVSNQKRAISDYQRWRITAGHVAKKF